MQKSYLAEVLEDIHSLQIKFGEVAGAAFAVELKMRLIAQLSKPVQSKLKELKLKQEYWECDLQHLDSIIETLFFHVLTAEERRALKAFRIPRDKLIHSDFAAVMDVLIDSDSGRNALNKGNMLEALGNLQKSQALEKLHCQANLASTVLDKIICNFGTD